MRSKREFQRDILLTWRRHPNAPDIKIADAVGCSTAYVKQVKDHFDSRHKLEELFDELVEDIDHSVEGLFHELYRSIEDEQLGA